MSKELRERRLQYFKNSPAKSMYSLAKKWRGLKPYELAKAMRDEFAKRFLGVSGEQLKDKKFRIEELRLEDIARKAASEDELEYENLSEEDRFTYRLIGDSRMHSLFAFKIKKGAWNEFDPAIKKAFSWINWRDGKAMDFWERMRYVLRFIRKLPSEQRVQKKVALENKYKGLIPPRICSLQACKFCWRFVPVPPGWGDVYCDEHSFTYLTGEPKSKNAVYNRKKRLLKSLTGSKFVDVDHMALSFYRRLSGGGWGELESGEEYFDHSKKYDHIKFVLRQSKEQSEYPEVSLLLKCLPNISKFFEEMGLDVSSMFELGEHLNITSINTADSIHFGRDFNDHREVIEYFSKIQMDTDLEVVDDISAFERFLKDSESDPRCFEEVHRKSIVIDLYYRCFASAEAWLLLDSACKHGGKRENAGRKRKNDETEPS